MTHGGKRSNAGRKAGEPNKLTTELKQMILNALDTAGGEQYLVDRAKDTPTAFMSLLGKVLPMAIAGEGEGKLTVTWEK